MCPMRVFLLLFSAILASYLAYRNFVKDEGLSVLSGAEEKADESKANATEAGSSPQQICSKVSFGFWTVVDMVSGRYLYKNLRSNPALQDAKSR